MNEILLSISALRAAAANIAPGILAAELHAACGNCGMPVLCYGDLEQPVRGWTGLIMRTISVRALSLNCSVYDEQCFVSTVSHCRTDDAKTRRKIFALAGAQLPLTRIPPLGDSDPGQFISRKPALSRRSVPAPDRGGLRGDRTVPAGLSLRTYTRLYVEGNVYLLGHVVPNLSLITCACPQQAGRRHSISWRSRYLSLFGYQGFLRR